MPKRRRQRFKPERETSGLMKVRVTCSRSSSGKSRVRRSSATIASCTGVNVVFKVWGQCDKSSCSTRPCHFRSCADSRCIEVLVLPVTAWRLGFRLVPSGLFLPDCECGGSCFWGPRNVINNTMQHFPCFEQGPAAYWYMITRRFTSRV